MLKVQMEILLPNENRRKEILKVHTAHKQECEECECGETYDVDFEELAALTKDFSKVELVGLVRAAQLVAMNRREVKTGDNAEVNSEVMNDLHVGRADFFQALKNIKPVKVQMKIPLPNENRRKEILKAHTPLKNVCGETCDVDFEELAALTANFSNVELVRLVRTAQSVAINRQIKDTDDVNVDPNTMNISRADFMDALKNIKPVQRKISLPNESRRKEILQAHTAHKRKCEKACECGDTYDVDFEELATLTKNFSKSQLVGLVRQVQSIAMDRLITATDKVEVNSDTRSKFHICRADFMQALESDIKPVQIDISLSNENRRKEILKAHIAHKRECGGECECGEIYDVNFEELVVLTKDFSKSELVGLVRAAQSVAMTRLTEGAKNVDVNPDTVDKLHVSHADFLQALKNIEPVQIKSSLPNENRRKEILKAHTPHKIESSKECECGEIYDIDFEELATLTKDFSKVELVGLVRAAQLVAMNQSSDTEVDPNTLNKFHISRADFLEALKNVTPAFNSSDQVLDQFVAHS